MSADGHNICPAYYHRATDVPFGEITQVEHLNEGEDVLDTSPEESLAEYFEHYIDKGHLVFKYHGAQCRACDYEIPAFTLRQPIPEPV